LPDSLASIQLNKKKRSLIVGATLFVFLVGFSLAGLVAWNSWQARVHKLRDTEIATSNMARALAQHAEDTIRGTDNVLAGLVEHVESKGIGSVQKESLHYFLMRRVAEQPMLHGLFVIDTSGKPIITSQPRMTANLNYADREYFGFHRAFADRGPHVGPAIRSRSTGDWVMTVSRRLNNPDGSFAGVVLATLTLDYFKYFYDEFDIGNTGVIFLASDDGTLLVRRPFIESIIGSDISNGPVFHQYRTVGPIGTAMLISKIDHLERLYSYRHLDTYPLIVAVALAKEDIFASWRTETYRLITAAAVLLLIIGSFGVYLIFQINQREAIEKELRNAKLSLENLNHELEALASEDSLTGLSNRRKFDAALKTEFNRALRNRSWISLIMIDVDRFKQFNDLYGHPAGDDCLAKISQALRYVPNRPGDLTARYGGEEMVVLLPETDEKGAAAIAERIRTAVEELGITHSANPGGIVTVSAGVAALLPVRGEKTAIQLLQTADEALYNAKAQGRNQVCTKTI